MLRPSAVVARHQEVKHVSVDTLDSNNTRWLHGNQEWETSTIVRAVLSIGPVRCYIRKTRCEEGQCFTPRVAAG
jgi:hypothetical protein